MNSIQVKTAAFLKAEIIDLLSKYVNLNHHDVDNILSRIDSLVGELYYDFRYNRNKYYSLNQSTFISLYNTGHIFKVFYGLSKMLFHDGALITAEKLYFANKAINGCDVYCAVNLPRIYHVEHPVGAVIGRAKIADYFSFQQSCTVGGDKGNIYPTIGKNVRMYANSSIIGECIIGDNVFVASNTHIKNTNIPSNSLVFGVSPNLTIKTKNKDYFVTNSLFNVG